MPTTPLDFRSDTVTRPTRAMRSAIEAAAVGDDVFDEDPTVNALQEKIADMLGKQAALFVPSGSMSNLVGIRVHCGPGDEFICETGCHILNYEQAAYAQLIGVAAQPIEGEFGVLQPEQLVGRIRSKDDHCPRTRMVTLENTHNRGAGRIQPLGVVEQICKWAHDHGLTTHLDGARLLNAAVATGIGADQWASHFDTVSVCFSKGLGAPVGSALCGSRDLIRRAHRYRKALGGAMRQAGIIAAGALYALEHHVDRLAEDHANARLLGKAIDQIDHLRLIPPDVQTNMVIFEVSKGLGSAQQFAQRLGQQGLLVLAIRSDRIRAVTHLDVARADVERAAEILAEQAAAGVE